MQDGVGLDPGREQGTVAAARHLVTSVRGPVREVRAPVELVQGSEQTDVRGSGEHGHVVAGRAVFLFGGKKKKNANRED